MQQQFLKKFFPSHRTNSFKRQITTFTQKPGETFYQCWDRYRDLLNTCPHHGFKTWRLVSHFYKGLTPKDRQIVELMCNGTFEDKDPNDAMEYMDLLAENAQNWDTTSTYKASSKTHPHTSSGGMYNLREDHYLQTKFKSLVRKVEALKLKKSGQLKFIQEIVCQICETNEHLTNDCSTLPSFKECLHEQINALNSFQRPNHNLYSQTYNSGWRNHPNFSWNSGNNNAQTSQPPFQAHHNFQIMDMHLLMLYLLKEILRKHCMHSLKSKSDVHHGNYNPSCKAKTNMQEDSDGPMTRARAKQLQRALTSQIGMIEAASELKISNQFEIG
jgi:hypothetical protein